MSGSLPLHEYVNYVSAFYWLVPVRRYGGAEPDRYCATHCHLGAELHRLSGAADLSEAPTSLAMNFYQLFLDSDTDMSGSLSLQEYANYASTLYCWDPVRRYVGAEPHRSGA